MKKKLIATILALTLVLSFALTACGGNTDGGKQSQAALTINAVTGKKAGDAPFSLTTAGGSGTGAVTFSQTSGADVASVSAVGLVTIIKEGDFTVTATKAGDADYNPISSAETIITIGAAEVQKELAAIAFFNDGGPAAFPQSLYQGDTLSSTEYAREGYNYSDFEALALTEYTGNWTLPEYAAFVDITGLTDSENTMRGYIYSEYNYTDTVNEIYYYFLDYGDYSYLECYDADYDFDSGFLTRIYTYGEMSVCIFDGYSAGCEDFYYIFTNNGTEKIYVEKDSAAQYENIPDDTLIDGGFVDAYCYNGIAFLTANNCLIQEGYISAMVTGSGFTDYFVVKEGSVIDLTGFGDYEYLKPARVAPGEIDFTFALSDMLTLEEMYESYSHKFNSFSWFDIDGVLYYIDAYEGEIYYVACETEIDGIFYRYDIRYENDEITDISYGRYNYDDIDDNYYLLSDAGGNIIDACIEEWVSASGVFIVDSIELYRLFEVWLIISIV